MFVLGDNFQEVKMKMKLTVVLALVFLAAGLYGQEAGEVVVRELAGTVEAKVPGSQVWEPVRRGQRLPLDALISTGFRSTAVIVLGSSTLTVRPLTRLSVAALFRGQGGERVDLALRTGRMRVEVKPPAGTNVDFTVRGPSITASVRGTVFDIDTLNLQVSEGTVEFAGAAGAPVLVDAGGTSYMDEGTGRTVSPIETASAGLRPELPPGAGAAAVASEAAPEQEQDSPFDMGISIQF
jgi:hypothetical protein